MTNMKEKERKDFCPECRKWTGYVLKKKEVKRNIKGRQCAFVITVAICAECGAEMCPHGLIDRNIEEIEDQYREKQDKQE